MSDPTQTQRTTVTTEGPVNGGTGATPPSPADAFRTLAVMSAPLVKVSACVALGAIGVSAQISGHDGNTLNTIVGAILAVSGMSVAAQFRAMALPSK